MRANSVPTYYVPECPDGWVAVGHTVLDAKGRVLAMCANGETARTMATAWEALGVCAALQELGKEPGWAAVTEAVYDATMRGPLGEGLLERVAGVLARVACQEMPDRLS